MAVRTTDALPWVVTMVRTIYQQPSPDEVHAQLDRVTDQLQNRSPQVASLLDEAGPDVLAFSNFPLAHWKKIWSNNPQERLNKEIRRRTDVVGIPAHGLGDCFVPQPAYFAFAVAELGDFHFPGRFVGALRRRGSVRSEGNPHR